jgi:hypothetical protein
VEGILRHLFRGLGAGKHPVEHPERHTTISVVQLAQRVRVTTGDPFDQHHIFLIGRYDAGRRTR